MLFFKGKTPRPSASSELLAAVRLHFGLREIDGVSISQIACSHPECGEAETVILVMREGEKTQAYKILKPLQDVGQEDLAQLVTS